MFCSEVTAEMTDNMLVNEYMKLYENILTFKDGLAKILLDKGTCMLVYRILYIVHQIHYSLHIERGQQ